MFSLYLDNMLGVKSINLSDDFRPAGINLYRQQAMRLFVSTLSFFYLFQVYFESKSSASNWSTTMEGKCLGVDATTSNELWLQSLFYDKQHKAPSDESPNRDRVQQIFTCTVRDGEL